VPWVPVRGAVLPARGAEVNSKYVVDGMVRVTKRISKLS